METVAGKLVTGAILIALTLGTGFILSRSGRPYAVGTLTVHKLIAAAAVVVLVLAVRQLVRLENASPASIVLGVTSAVVFVALIATGALLTREELALPQFVSVIHRLAPYVALASSGATFVLMIGGRP